MKRIFLLLFPFVLVLFLSFPVGAFSADVYEIAVQGVISPPVSAFIGDSLRKAVDARASALLILLDTPGGLDTAMREIVKAMMDAPIPTIVYVYPSGARAASAGTIILIAAQVAAMAPGTNVGAAHPVNVGSGKMDKEMMAKVVQDAQAYARSLAAKRGRNVEWAAKAVRESVSVTASEALSANVIDVMADNVGDLLSKIDGRVVEVGTGRVALHTKGARIVNVEMPFKYRLLSYISDPSVAYLLMMIGFYGILFEIYSPGTIFPGVIGGICLILALYAFQTIPISYAGLSLILLGVIFFVVELKVASHGLLGIAGVISIVIGSVMLIDLPQSWLSISWQSIATVAVVSVIFFFTVLSYAVKAQLSKVRTGREGMIGEAGVARSNIAPSGKVFLHGELWDARADEPIQAGERVVIVAVEGMVVKVKKEGGT
jgi:membrane-bound serine protease (ClpP class)